MSTASVSNTFVASTTAESAKVNTNFSDLVNFLNNSVIHRDGTKAMTSNLDMDSNKVTNVASGTASTDAVNYGQLTSYTPPGVMAMYSAASAPSGWLLCDGSAVSRTTYSALFAIISTTYGSGDGSTTFNLPDLQGAFPVGYDSGDTSFDALGETGGSKDAIVVTHSHTINHGHSDTFATASGGSHTHSDTFAVASGGAHQHRTYEVNNTTSAMVSGSSYALAAGSTRADSDLYDIMTSSAGSHSHTLTGSVSSGGSHTHSITGAVTDHSGSSGSSGSSGTNANLPPYFTVNFIIKT